MYGRTFPREPPRQGYEHETVSKGYRRARRQFVHAGDYAYWKRAMRRRERHAKERDMRDGYDGL